MAMEVTRYEDGYVFRFRATGATKLAATVACTGRVYRCDCSDQPNWFAEPGAVAPCDHIHQAYLWMLNKDGRIRDMQRQAKEAADRLIQEKTKGANIQVHPLDAKRKITLE